MITNKFFNLQRFAEGEDAGEEVNGTGAAQEPEEKTAEGKTSDFDEFLKDPKNQSEFDKRVAKALDTQKKNLDQGYQKEIEDAKKEAAKLAKMNKDQQTEYEMERLKAENEKLKAEAVKSELGKTAAALLKEKNIDATQDMLDFVVGGDAESTKANIEKFVSIINSQLQKAEAERATGTTPKRYETPEPLDEIAKRTEKYRKAGRNV